MQGLTHTAADMPLFLFLVMALMPLVAPGPTNTLLLVGGATDGVIASFLLVPAELLGYLTAIHILAFSIGPLMQASNVAQIGIRIGITLYLLWLAVKLLAEEPSLCQQRAITPQRVFVTTLLNPKAAYFAFIVLPPLAGGHWLSSVPYLLWLSVLIVGANLCWTSLGAAIGSGRIVSISPRIVRVTASAAMIVFAALINAPLILAVH